MKFGLLGYPLSHSMSQFIHNELFSVSQLKASYKMVECEILDGKCIERLKELDGFNVTIPYKNKIINYLNKLEQKAECFQSVNTVSVKERKGYNTDVDGFLDSVVKINAELSGNNLVLGAGGVARMVIYEIVSRGGKAVIAVRPKSFSKAQKLKEELTQKIKDAKITIDDINNIKGNFDLLINCTPVGMYPDTKKSPVEESVVKNCKAVVDLIYNPQETELLKMAKNINKPCIGGMYMLVKQAAKAQEIWTGISFGDFILEEVAKKANIYMRRVFQKQNVAFTGFMASGKTTLAKAFAQKNNMSFVDIDQVIVEREKKSIPAIFEEKGEEYFRELERNLIEEFSQKKDIVISLGGGAVMDEKNREIIKKTAIAIYIDTPYDICLDRIKAEGNRPVAQNKGEKLRELYSVRDKIYSEIADIKVDGQRELEEKLSYVSGFFSPRD